MRQVVNTTLVTLLSGALSLYASGCCGNEPTEEPKEDCGCENAIDTDICELTDDLYTFYRNFIGDSGKTTLYVLLDEEELEAYKEDPNNTPVNGCYSVIFSGNWVDFFYSPPVDSRGFYTDLPFQTSDSEGDGIPGNDWRVPITNSHYKIHLQRMNQIISDRYGDKFSSPKHHLERDCS